MSIRHRALRSLLALTAAAGLAGTAVTNTFANNPAHAGALPDFAVQQLSAVSGHDRIAIANLTSVNPGAPIRVAVLAGPATYSFSVLLGPADQQIVTLHQFACGQPVAVIVNVDKTVRESTYANNSLGFTSKAHCTIPIDPGWAGNPVHE